MPAVVVSSRYCLQYNDQTMLIPEAMVVPFEGKDYLSIQPYSATLIKFLWPGTRTSNKPSCASSSVLKELQTLRADAVAKGRPEGQREEDVDDLFGSGTAAKPRKRKAKAKGPAEDQLATFDFKGISITCPSFAALGERQQVLLPLDDALQLQAVFDALAAEPFENCSQKRSYVQSGKHSKTKKDDVQLDAGEAEEHADDP